ncbi:MAG TPA: zinc-ribbon domain-containing protein [Pilimelia sp.]|nr:zinc-ribbon domain-containing protein [Pilimelia sp.]
MIIFGFRTSVRQLAVLQAICRVCGNAAAQTLFLRTTKFSLFFIPLFPVRRKRVLQCSFCAATYPASDQDVARLAG